MQQKYGEKTASIKLRNDKPCRIVAELARTNAAQQEEIRMLRARKYGKSSEKLTQEDKRQGAPLHRSRNLRVATR
ncbi:MAG: hypothetical protein NT080_11190 [Spirochaetes bacterium]|nr:hypothetical protein [Spirochaetota bacterium]